MHVRQFALACVVTLALAACERGAEKPAEEASSELAWARAALERNPNLEVLAADEDEGVFTVRNRTSGEVQAVNVDEIAAAPAAELAGTRPAPVVDEEPFEPAPAQDESADALVADEPTDEAPSFDYKVERRGGEIHVTGPGVSIVSAGAAAAPTARADPERRTVDPFICEGPRMMRFDDRHIFVDGNAVTARDGCELHITNSRIAASGTGVVVRNATVHITNSTIEGVAGSYDAGPGAKVFLRGAILHGTLRRDATAEIQELSGRL